MALDQQTALSAYQAFFPDAPARLAQGDDDFNAFWASLEENNISAQTLEALKAMFAVRPDQAQAFLEQGGDVAQYLEGMVAFWNSEGGRNAAPNLADFAPEMAVLDTLGLEPDPDALTEATGLSQTNQYPLEQSVANTLLQNNIIPDLNADPVNRDAAQKIVDDANTAFTRAIEQNNQVFDHVDWDKYLTDNPDVAEWATNAVATGTFPDLATAAAYHYKTSGSGEGRKVTITNRLKQEYENANKVVAELSAAAEQSAKDKLAAIDNRRAEMTAALAEMEKDRSGALDAQVAALRTAIGQLETERTAALEQLNSARTAAADANVAARLKAATDTNAARLDAAQRVVQGVNLGLESERDRIVREAAKQGFVGGSSMQNAELARAAIGARQAGAELAGNARLTNTQELGQANLTNSQELGSTRVSNATDTRGLKDEMAGARFSLSNYEAGERKGLADQMATGRFNLADTLSQGRLGVNTELADNKRTAANQGTTMRSTYFDNDLGRRVQASLFPAQIATNRLNLLTAPIEVGSAGAKNALNLLNFFADSPSPPSTTPTQTTASTVGKDIASLGAGLVSGGFNLAGKTDWSKVFGKKDADDEYNNQLWSNVTGGN